jgi:hypothetical protein
MSGKKDQPVEENGKGASLDPRPFGGAVADPLKVKEPGEQATPKKARSRERKKRNVGPFE